MAPRYLSVVPGVEGLTMKIAGYEFGAARVKGHALVLFGTRHSEKDGDAELRFKVAAGLTKVKEVIIDQLKKGQPAVHLMAVLENGNLTFGFIDHARTLEKETRVIPMGGENEHDPDTCAMCRLDRHYGVDKRGG